MVSMKTPARGFTLPELMTVLVIMAVLGAMAAPAYGDWVASSRARSAGTDLHMALNLARSEAIKRNAEVTLAANEDGWQAGWQIAAPGDADRLLHDHPALAGVSIDGPDSVTYLPSGRIRGSTLPAFDIAATTGDERRCVKADLSGRPNLTHSRC